MAARSADVSNLNHVADIGQTIFNQFVIKNGVQLYYGSIGAIDSTGYLKAWAAASGEKRIGLIQKTGKLSEAATVLKGNTGLAEPPVAVVNIGRWNLNKVTVAGASSIAAAMLQPVWLSTDNFDADLTLTRPSTGGDAPFGYIIKYHSGSIANVAVVGMLDSLLASKAASKGELFFAHVEGATGSPVTVAASQFGRKLIAPFHGKITGFKVYVTSTLTGGPVTFAPTIDPGNAGSPVAVTGGVATALVTAAGKSLYTATAITGGNEFHEGDALDILTSTVTNITAGGLDFVFQVERLEGV